MALAAAELLGSIVAPHTANCGGLHRLTVDDPGARLAMATDPRPDTLPQRGIQPLPGAIQPPATKPPVDGRPRRVLVGQLPPLSPSADKIEDRVQDLPQRPAPRAPTRLRQR